MDSGRARRRFAVRFSTLRFTEFSNRLGGTSVRLLNEACNSLRFAEDGDDEGKLLILLFETSVCVRVCVCV